MTDVKQPARAKTWNQVLLEIEQKFALGQLDQGWLDRTVASGGGAADAPPADARVTDVVDARRRGQAVWQAFLACKGLHKRGAEDSTLRGHIYALVRMPGCPPPFKEQVAAMLGLEVEELLRKARKAQTAANRKIRQRGTPPKASPAEPPSADEADEGLLLDDRRPLPPEGYTALISAFDADAHFVGQLPPRATWTLVVDESGDFAPGCDCVVVGLLIPMASKLPQLPDTWHATSEPESERAAVVSALAGSGFGIFGVSTAALGLTGEQRWETAVISVIEWVTRLLPLKARTSLHIQIEQRARHSAGTAWDPMIASIQRDLKRRAPKRSANLKVARIDVVTKGAQSHNGYVDALANLWWTRRLQATAGATLIDTCLMERSIAGWDTLWDACVPGHLPQWQLLDAFLLDPRIKGPEGLAPALYERVTGFLLDDPAALQACVHRVWGHAESGRVDAALMQAQVALLLEVRARGGRRLGLGPLEELRLAILEHNHGNHSGLVDADGADPLAPLCEQLREDDPALVCQADLVRAVRATNSYDFVAARRALDRWASRTPPNRQQAGRLASTAGQHAAFLGDWAAARAHFERALQAFGAMADPTAREEDLRRTRIYLALAAVDAPEAPQKEVAALVAAALEAPLTPEGVARQATNLERPYRHHLLVRHLAAQGPPDLVGAYLAAREGWATGTSHPWPQIGVQRALILWQSGEVDAATTAWQRAVTEAAAHGPTMQVIALMLAQAAARTNVLRVRAPEVDREALQRLIPAAPWHLLEGWPEWRRVMREGAPFNFR